MPIFDTRSLHDAVTKQLTEAWIPEGHSNAFAVIATTGGVKAVLSTRINNVWQVDSVVNVSSQGKVDGGIQVKATW